MASNTIKGLTVEIGGDTTKLGKALENVNKKTRDLSSELGQINKLLKLDPGNTELLAQKQQVLAEAIDNTKDKLQTLKEAEAQVQAQFERGEISESQYRDLQREIIATEKKLEGYEKALAETADAAQELGDESVNAAEDLKKEKAQAEEAEQATEELGASMADAAKTGAAALAAAATALVGAIVATAEATREYRTALGKLDTAFKDADFSAEEAYETYSELQGVLGDTDQAVEAANHLAKLVDNEQELAEWTDIATGVYATFGDSLPIEGLTEAANETAKTSELTGGLADAINWAAEEGETYGVVLKEATEENEEWNKAVKEATKAEDFFNLALQECTTEQERQQLITKTLSKSYKSAAAQYKITNKEVIRANQATEKLNATMAKIGGTVEPVVTDFKELGATILEEAQEPIADLAGFVSDDLLPALIKSGKWVRDNKALILGTVTGLTVAITGYKVATIAADLAEKGLTVSIIARTAAQKALNLAMAATPAGLVTTAIAGLVAGLVVYATTMDNTKERVQVLTEEEQKLVEAALQSAEAFREQQTATQESMGNTIAQSTHIKSLTDELLRMAGASGQVKEADQARAQYILGELNTALGTEYSMVDGVIQKYDELEANIYDVINAKTANSLLEAYNADYITAIELETEALKGLVLAEEDYRGQLSLKQQAEEEYQAQVELMRQRDEDDYYVWNEQLRIMDENRLAQLAAKLEEEEGILAEKKTAYDEAAANYGNYSNTIANYEEAQTAALQGNSQKAIDILTKKGVSFGKYSDKVDTETAKVLDTLFKEAVDAGLAAERTKTNFENGVDGYTEEMVKEAEKSYDEALGAYADAYADAEGVGGDLSDGLKDGMEGGRLGLLSKARSLVSGIISAMRDEADSHSPARKTIDFGEDVGEGAEIGIENKTKDVVKAAKNQTAAVMEAYSDQELAGQASLRSVAQRQASSPLYNGGAQFAASQSMMEKILAAIERGQVLTIDGDKLVGATADRYDNQLGQRRVLAERGAI